MVELDALERSIVDRVNAIPGRAAEEIWNSERSWTSAILLDLAKLGHESGFYVCGKGCSDYGQGEWLYDLVWLQMESDHIRDVPMVLESEWSRDSRSISEDFMKLLVGRAEHRVMVFQQKSRKELDDIAEGLMAQVRSFRPSQKGDRYLLLGFDWADQRRFNPRVYVA